MTIQQTIYGFAVGAITLVAFADMAFADEQQYMSCITPKVVDYMLIEQPDDTMAMFVMFGGRETFETFLVGKMLEGENNELYVATLAGRDALVEHLTNSGDPATMSISDGVVACAEEYVW